MNTGKSEQSRHYSRIAVKAMSSIAFPILAALVLIIAVTTYFSYRISIKTLQNQVQRIGHENLTVIETLLWQFDIESVNSELIRLIERPGIQRAFIEDAMGQPISRGLASSDTQDPIIATFNLTHADGRGALEALGQLTIEADKSGIWSSVFRLTTAVALLFTLTAAFVTLLIMRQLNQSLFGPLVSLSARLRNTPLNGRIVDVENNRRHTGETRDELDELIDSIHIMRGQIITTQKAMDQGSERLASATHMAGLAFATFDPTLENLLACDENYAALHRKSVDEMLAMDIMEDFVSKALSEADLQRARDGRIRVINGNNEIITFRLEFDDGEFMFLRQFFVPKQDAAGTLIDIDVIAQDVTHDHINQEILLQSQKNEAIGNLTGGVAHDFNNILAVIAGNLEMSNKCTHDPRVRSYNSTALETVNRGARLTQQLLSFARKQPMSPVVMDVSKLVRDSTMLLRTSVGESVDLEIINDGGLWRTLADQAQLEAVLLNLVVNARDAMPSGGTLTIETSNARLDPHYARANMEVVAGNYVCLSVTDSGQGMSQDIIRQCIEPFFTTKAAGEGTGLGLSMAFGFAKQSKGHLKIYSEEGHGTTVKLYLPKVQQQVARIAPVMPKDHHAKLAGLSILIIEDNEQLRQIITTQLQSLGCSVQGAFDETSALALGTSLSHVDIILSDIILPGNTNGRLITEKLARHLPDAKVVFMSGFTENSIIHNGQIDEGIVFLQKPFRMDELAQVLADRIAVV